MRDLRQRIREEEDRQLWPTIESRLDAIEGDVEALLDPRAHGRGRALFVAVGDGRTETVSIQMPFRERVIYDRTAFIRPLVAAHDEGRAAGVLAAHRDGIRILEWSTGEAAELESRSFELGDAQLADVKSGPAGQNPRLMQQSAVNRERFEDRIDDNRHRFLKSAVHDVTGMAKERGWDRVVVAGPPKIRQEVAAALTSENGFTVLEADQAWEIESPSTIAGQLWPILRSRHRQRECDLVTMAIDRSAAGQTGAVGMRNVLNALNQGQVQHLLFRADLEVEGYTTEEDTLHAVVGGAAAQAGFEMHREPLFVERMIEKVIAMGGRVTPVEEEAAELLDGHDGVAALLRW
jgi:peptide subunit release factor 1 (eRF1)